MSQNVAFSVIVPTRERARTLGATLRTILSQDYPAFEVVVSDNASQDNTAELVKDLSDERIRYFNTGRRLAMHENWNFALEKVRGDFVTVIGDDDGLVPSALHDMATLLETTGTKAVCWQKIEYCWPDHPVAHLKSRLTIPLTNDLMRLNAEAVLRDLCRFLFPYNRTPTLYNSFVATEAVRACTPANGSFLNSSSPDVYSGVALLDQLKDYFYVSRPFSINGASAASNGTSFSSVTNRSPYAMFLRELGSDYSYAFGRIHGSVNAELLEALLQANMHQYGGRLRIAKRLAVARIYAELSRKEDRQRDEGLNDLVQATQQRGLSRSFKVAKALFPLKSHPASAMALLNARDDLTVDASKFGVIDVAGASEFAGALLGPYIKPDRIQTYSLSKRIMSHAARKLPVARLIGTPSAI